MQCYLVDITIGTALPQNTPSGVNTSNSTVVSSTRNGDACGQVTNVYVQGGKEGEAGPQGPRGDTGPPGNVLHIWTVITITYRSSR